MQHSQSSIFLEACGIFLAEACGTYFPDQGSNLGLPALGVQSLSHWTTHNSCFISICKICFFQSCMLYMGVHCALSILLSA